MPVVLLGDFESGSPHVHVVRERGKRSSLESEDFMIGLKSAMRFLAWTVEILATHSPRPGDYFVSPARLFVVFLNQSQILVEFIASRCACGFTFAGFLLHGSERHVGLGQSSVSERVVRIPGDILFEVRDATSNALLVATNPEVQALQVQIVCDQIFRQGRLGKNEARTRR